jgi:hypothetical protein
MRHHLDVQEPVVLLWKTKCEVQLEMLGVCNSNALFEYVPEVEREYSCPFTITSPAYSTRQYYVTPGCLVWVKSEVTGEGGSFYDPSTLHGDISIHDIVNHGDSRVPFDIRQTGSLEALGTWPITFLAEDDDANTRNTALATLLTQYYVDRRNGSIPWRLGSQFVDKVVRHPILRSVLLQIFSGM